VKDGVLEVRGRRVEIDPIKLAPPPPECADAKPPTVGGVWNSAGDGEIVVRLDSAGSASCPTPRQVWRVLHVKGASSQPAAGSLEQASALNTRGMRKFRAKDWAGAAADFRGAIDLYPDHVKAHYNLACLASITKDRETALEQLRWLAASPLAEAGDRIVKARTDPDLSFIRADPDAHAILAGGQGRPSRRRAAGSRGANRRASSSAARAAASSPRTRSRSADRTRLAAS